MKLKLLRLQKITSAVFTIACAFLISFSSPAQAQQKPDCEKLLDQEPYFVKHKTDEKDPGLKRDIEILKNCGNFSGTDSVFLKGPILGVLMLEQVNAGKPATYRTIISFFKEFRNTAKYKDFSYGLSLSREIGQKKIDPQTWEKDKELFVRMGFTVNDLEDFKTYMSKPENSSLTYMDVLKKYMAGLEALRVDKK